MSIALVRNNSGGDHRIERPGFVTPIYNSLEFTATDRRAEKEDRSGSLSSSSTSSIGKNSDESVGGGDEEEVQSEYKGGPLDSLDALEEVLPMKKSISNFYSGKSKSFTILSDAASCSIEDIRKPENAYTRKRKNLLAFNNFWDKNRGSISRGNSHGISKKPINSRSMLSLVAATNCSESNSGETSNSLSSSPGCCLPPLPPQARIALQNEQPASPPVAKFPSWRAFSLTDLQSADAATTAIPRTTGLWINTSNE